MYNFDPYTVLLSIATNIPVLLMTAFVLQGHIFPIMNYDTAWCVWVGLLSHHEMRRACLFCFCCAPESDCCIHSRTTSSSVIQHNGVCTHPDAVKHEGEAFSGQPVPVTERVHHGPLRANTQLSGVKQT